MHGEVKKKRWRERDDGGRGVEGKLFLKMGKGGGGQNEKEKAAAVFPLCCSENRLPVPADPEQLVPAFTKVTSLYLNKMSLSWEQVGTFLFAVALHPQIPQGQDQVHLLFTSRD